MALHEQLLPNLIGAIRGEKSAHVVGIDGGTVNYKHMEAGTDFILNPSPRTEKRFLDLLKEQKEIGHLTLRGRLGAATEAGSPGMHFTMNLAPVVGVLQSALKRGMNDLAEACTGWIIDAAGLCRGFRWRGEVWIPAPRVKDDEGKKQKPWDGYRDIFAKLAFGERVNKPDRYWRDDQSIGVATFREVLRKSPAIVKLCRAAEIPKLYLPIQKKDLPNGGFIAWIEDTEHNRAAMGEDACDWVRCAPDGVSFGYDFEREVPRE